jgi:HemY protein
MIRVILFLALVALIALGVVWIADRPGDVAITWQGYRIETSVTVMAVAIAAIVVVALLLWSLIRTILRSPDLIAMFLGHRRGVRGYLAISRGLIAIGAGDARAARKFAEEAERIAPGEPLALLLNAQCAQIAGDGTGAEFAFRAMTERNDTKLLGLRGLYVEAQRRADGEAARGYAEEAAKAAPSLAWAGQAVLEYRCATGDWVGALAGLDRNSRYGLIDKAGYRRQRAVLLTARALTAEESDPDRARALALEAVKLAPALVPAADLAARLLGERGELKKASRIVEAAWKANPHPDLADTYAHLRSGESARERLARVQALAQKSPSHVESALAVARAALDAQEFAVARVALQPLLREPTQRVAELMAEIEQRESGDEGRAREWMARALHAAKDPAWTADGFVSDRWMPVSLVSGRLDAFQWKVPLEELGAAREAIEAGDPRAAVATNRSPIPAAAPVEAEATDRAADPTPRDEPVASPRAARRSAALPSPRAAAASRVEAVIPLVHAPDDPGPDPQPEAEPELPDDARRRLRSPK